MRIGIDFGGTKIAGVVLDNDGRVVARDRVPTPHADYSAILRAITETVLTLEARVGQHCSVGVGMPGILSPHSGLVKNSNTAVLNGKHLDRDLRDVLARDIRFENDANCFALSEAIDGAGAQYGVVFGVIIGTGTGGGIIVNKQIWRGANAIAGEWGHNPLPWPRPREVPGPSCYCGQRGCLETYLSGPGLVRAFVEKGGDQLQAHEIAALADRGDERARDVLSGYVDQLARGLASVINMLDPDVIVLGGGLSNISSLYESVPPALPTYVFSDHVATRVVAARHGAGGGVRGAAWLWPPA